MVLFCLGVGSANQLVHRLSQIDTPLPERNHLRPDLCRRPVQVLGSSRARDSGAGGALPSGGFCFGDLVADRSDRPVKSAKRRRFGHS